MAIAVTMTGLGGDPGTTNPFVIASVSAASTAGRCILAFVAMSDTSKFVSSMDDDAVGHPMPWSFVGSISVTGMRLELWMTPATGSLGGASAIKANLSGLTPCSITVIELSGVSSIGGNSNANNTNANPTISRTTVDANNYVVAGFGSVGATTATGGTGTLERTINSAGASPVVCSLVDNTAASPGVVTDSITLGATTWGALAIELRTLAPTPKGMLLMGVG